jgi:hypothetical protein
MPSVRTAISAGWQAAGLIITEGKQLPDVSWRRRTVSVRHVKSACRFGAVTLAAASGVLSLAGALGWL